jgi:DNA-directed RNA polymerase subunit RPC12/RpoP
VNFYYCEKCKDFFADKEIIIEKDNLHCPHCGSLVKRAEAHVDHRGRMEKMVDIGKAMAAVQILKEIIHDFEYFLTGDKDDPITIAYDRIGEAVDLLEGKSDDVQG